MDACFFDRNAAKKSTNLSINSDLLRLAKERHINLSQTLEGALAELLREEASRSWQEESKGAIEDYNARVKQHGAFGDGLRRF